MGLEDTKEVGLGGMCIGDCNGCMGVGVSLL